MKKHKKFDVIFFILIALMCFIILPKDIMGFLEGAFVLALYLLASFISSSLESSVNKKYKLRAEQVEEKHEKYLSSYGNIESDTLHGGSMRSDLMYRFRSPLSLAAALFCTALIVLCLALKIVSLPMKIAFTAFFGGITAVCLYSFFRMPVRFFFSRISSHKDDIERSYVNGSMFVFKKFGLRNGMNIGGQYLVFYSGYSVNVVPNDTITDFKRTERREKYYSSGVYTGERMVYNIEIIASPSELNPKSSYTIELDEFQAEKASGLLRDIVSLNQIHNNIY